jgi:ABC-type sugar transport system permease subunit
MLISLRSQIRGQSYVAPAMLLVGFMLVLPSIYGFYYSLHEIKYLRATDFIGLGNYLYLVTDPAFFGVIARSTVFTALAVIVTIVLALAIALWIDRLTGLFALFVQIIVVLPWVISHVVGALLFRWVFVNDIGVGMYLLEQLGIRNFHPLSDPTMAMAVMIAFACWRTLGFAMLLLLAGLKSIPVELYEAAHVDGASAWQRFRRITLPMLRTPMLITLVILTISNLNNVEGPLIVTGGGPADATNVVALDLYMRAFARFDYDTAIALGIGMFVANILLALAYVRLVKRGG